MASWTEIVDHARRIGARVVIDPETLAGGFATVMYVRLDDEENPVGLPVMTDGATVEEARDGLAILLCLEPEVVPA